MADSKLPFTFSEIFAYIFGLSMLRGYPAVFSLFQKSLSKGLSERCHLGITPSLFIADYVECEGSIYFETSTSLNMSFPCHERNFKERVKSMK